MKKLILMYQDTMDGNIFFRIEEQSHIGETFGDNVNFYKHDSVTLRSMEYPAIYIYAIDNISLYCMGRDAEGNHYSLITPSEYWEQIKETVKEYNKHFGYYGECILDDPTEIIEDIVPLEMFIIE